MISDPVGTRASHEAVSYDLSAPKGDIKRGKKNAGDKAYVPRAFYSNKSAR